MKNKHYLTKQYRPNLVSLMALCAKNYLLLIKLLANNDTVGEQRCFSIGASLLYVVHIDEVTRYTTLITLTQKNNVSASHVSVDSTVSGTKLIHHCLKVRLYHDAQMAEVISYQKMQQIKPRYDYPNEKMHQQDEKQQINQFLKEYLQLCLKLGQANVVLT